MSKEEAISVANSKLIELRQQSFQTLVNFLSPEGTKSMFVLGGSGKKYQLQIESFWDDPKEKHLRVTVSVDDGSLLRSFSPWSVDFIVDSNGDFLGE